MVFANQFFYDTFMAILPLGDRLRRSQSMFPFWRVPEEVEVKQDFGHIKFPFLNDIFSKVRLFIFYLKPW